MYSLFWHENYITVLETELPENLLASQTAFRYHAKFYLNIYTGLDYGMYLLCTMFERSNMLHSFQTKEFTQIEPKQGLI